MRRLHLFEWEDQAWLPSVFRDFITDHLSYFLSHEMRGPVNQAMADHMKPLLAGAEDNQIIDLCAGAGGPLLHIRQILSQDLEEPVNVLLTDLYPNVEAFERCDREGKGAVSACYQSTSAFDVPESFRGLRTLFTALHHFPPQGVKKILADAVRKQQPIAIFEPLERTPRVLFLTGLFALWHAFFLTPWIGPMTWRRWSLTYVVPVAPAVILWDGLVSVFRTYTPQELLNLAQSVGGEGYHWESGRFDIPGPCGLSMPTIFLLGKPADARAE